MIGCWRAIKSFWERRLELGGCLGMDGVRGKDSTITTRLKDMNSQLRGPLTSISNARYIYLQFSAISSEICQVF